MAGAGCSPEPVAVGAFLSGTFLNAVRIALTDAGPMPVLDTVLLGESTNRATPAIANAERAVQTRGMVAVVGHSNSAASLAASPIYNDAEIVQIAPTSTATRYAEAGPYSFRLVPPDDRQGAFLAQSLSTLFPAGARVAVFYVNDDYGRGLRTALLASLDTANYRVVFDAPHSDDEVENPPPDRRDRVVDVITTVRTARPTVVFWLGRSTTFEMYLRELRRHLGAIPILGGDALGSWPNRDTSTGDWAGIRFVDFLDIDGSAALRDFRDRYASRFQTQAGASEVLSYDAMSLILAAIRDGARTGAEVRAWLLSLGRSRPPYSGLSGPISFTDSGEVERSYHLTTIPGAR
jgi:branched-chain amino acid transport system substrate-binding protein